MVHSWIYYWLFYWIGKKIQVKYSFEEKINSHSLLELKLVHANTGLSAFEFNKDGTNRMLFINSSDHLDDEFVPLPGEASKLENAVDYENDEELEKKILEHPHPLHRSMSAGYSLKKKAEKDRKKKKGHLLETCEEEDYPSPDLKESAETVEKIPAKAVAAYSLEF